MTEDKQAQGRRNRLTGQWGEALVAQDLRDKGWQVLASGFRCRFGEIDLIVQNRTYLVFVEVKLRKNAAYSTPGAYVTQAKQSRLRATAEYYLARYPTHLQPRFDVAEVYAPQGTNTAAPTIHYIENAF